MSLAAPGPSPSTDSDSTGRATFGSDSRQAANTTTHRLFAYQPPDAGASPSVARDTSDASRFSRSPHRQKPARGTVRLGEWSVWGHRQPGVAVPRVTRRV